MQSLIKIFDFLHQIEKLKSTLRYNTTTSGRKESSAEHSWRLAVLTMIIAEELKLDLNLFHSIKIALIHDLPESIAGDWDSYKVSTGELSKKDKERAEKKAMVKLKKALPLKIGKEFYELWLEYETQETKEAKYIKALDKIETLLQFAETGYEIFDEGIDHIAFYADKHVEKMPELRKVLVLVKEELKREFKRGNIPWKTEYDRF